jgi:predicted transcriptional regulator
MKLPVDTSAIAFLCAVEAEPVIDFETRRPRADENGEPLYVVQLIALSDRAAEIIAVKVPGQPGSGIRQGHPVKVSGLVAQPWTMGDRSGVAFRAARIEPAVAQAQAKAS